MFTVVVSLMAKQPCLQRSVFRAHGRLRLSTSLLCWGLINQHERIIIAIVVHGQGVPAILQAKLANTLRLGAEPLRLEPLQLFPSGAGNSQGIESAQISGYPVTRVLALSLGRLYQFNCWSLHDCLS